MGTPAKIDFRDGRDVIELFTRWDGFSEDIRNHIKQTIENWQKSVDFLEQALPGTPSGQGYTLKWVERLKKALAQHRAHPSARSLATLYVGRSFTHAHPIYRDLKDGEDRNGYWREGEPDVECKMNEVGVPQFNKKRVPPEAEIVPEEWETLRLIEVDASSTEATGNEVDVKYRAGHRHEVLEALVRIPQLYRNLHQVCKVKFEEGYWEEVNKAGWIRQMRSINKMDAYYRPAPPYDRFLGKAKNLNFSTAEDRAKLAKEIMLNVESLLPMEVFVATIPNHLCFALPDIVRLPGSIEQTQAGDPDITVLVDDSRVPSIFINGVDQDMEFLRSTHEAVMQDEAEYRAAHGIPYGPEYKPSFVRFEKYPERGSLFMVPLEIAFIGFMNGQYDIEVAELRAAKATKKMKP